VLILKSKIGQIGKKTDIVETDKKALKTVILDMAGKPFHVKLNTLVNAKGKAKEVTSGNLMYISHVKIRQDDQSVDVYNRVMQCAEFPFNQLREVKKGSDHVVFVLA
jgi:hypothetical protein